MRREHWSSRTGFILATTGSAVGIGNIWRFPYLVGQNGGGAFLLAYLLSVLAVAIPLLILELSIGRRYHTSALGVFIAIGRGYHWVGLGILLLVAGVLSYYLVIIGWGLGFLMRTLFRQPLDFTAFIQGWEVLACFALALLLVMAVVAGGIKGGIERANLVLMPLLLLLVATLALYSLTLSGRGDGLAFYLKPDLSTLGDMNTWGAALGQAFFSVGVGMGVMMTYGSYVSRDTDLHASSLLIVFSDLVIAFLVGIMIFPMVFTFGLGVAAGPELAFRTLPLTFDQLPLSWLWGVVFFLLFVSAGVSSAISMLEAIVAPLVDNMQWRRSRAVLAAGVVVLLVGIPSALSYTGVELRVNGERILDLMDANLGSVGLPMAGLVGGLVMAWAAGKAGTIAEINLGTRWPVGRLVLFLTRYIVPLGLLVTITLALTSRFG